MDKKYEITDEYLAKLSKKMWDFQSRILSGSVDPERAMMLLGLATDAPRQPCDEGSTWGRYLLESEWTYDNFHREFATINLEKCDSPIPFEKILDPTKEKECREFLRKLLTGINDAQVPKHGSYKLVRLYRILVLNDYGREVGSGLEDSRNKEVVDLHFILKPICDFTKDGEPVPCDFQ